MSHGEDLRHECNNDEFVSEITVNPTTATLNDADKALVSFAEILTREPWTVNESHLTNLRSAGFSDRAIHDAVQVISMFNYYNRIANGLGVSLSDDDA